MAKSKRGQHPDPRHPSHLPGPQRQTRRTDIQSLRALAIGLVVAAHAHFPWLQGGYVGVDVFFVLSGYLISGLVLHEFDSTGHFKPWLFYARRLKRLLPAMLFVLLSVAVIAWLFVSPLDQGADADAGQSATIWLSNFYFAARVINYFSGGLNSNLYLHTWSLAVEEQFYLVWPWLLLFSYGVWKWQGSPMSRKRLAINLGMVAAASLLLGFYWSRTNIEAGFYLMPGRVWEFALGALTFLLRQEIEMGRFAWLERLRGRSLLNTIGLLFILLISVIYSGNMRYPGLWALLPCLGAVLILLDAPEKQPAGLVSRLVLGESFLQFVGNISYSLYLWHWPVLILGSQIFGSGALVQLGLVVLSVGLATATYYMIENPIHRAPMNSALKILIPSALGLVLGFFSMNVWQSAVANVLQEPVQKHILARKWDAPIIYERDCDTWYRSAEVSACAYGPPHARHSAVLFGDSVLAEWFPAVADIYLHMPDWRLVVLTKSACSMPQISYYYDQIKAEYTVCDLWRQRALDYIVQMHPDVVIMGSSRYDFTPQQWITGTQAVLNRVSPAAHAVAIISPPPELGFDGLDCIAAAANWPRWLPQPRRCETVLKPPSSQSVLSLLKQAAQPYSNVHVIDLDNAVCPNRICRARLGQAIVYRDSLHLTASFVQSLAPTLRGFLHADHMLK